MGSITKRHLGHGTTRKAGHIIELLIIGAMKIIYLVPQLSENID
jgi:hypothetical protein